MPAVAVTDHGNLFGAIELVMETNSLNKSVAAWNKEHPAGPQKQEVKPIFGCEVYLSPTPISCLLYTSCGAGDAGTSAGRNGGRYR